MESEFRRYLFITRKLYINLGKKLRTLNKFNNIRIPLTSSLILTSCLEIIDCLESDKDFYLESIYENSIMSDNRKVVEEIIETQRDKLDRLLRKDALPYNPDDFKDIEQKAVQETTSQFLDRTNDNTQFKAGLECYLEMAKNIVGMVEQKHLQNEDASVEFTKSLLDGMLHQVEEVDSLTECHLRDPVLMDNLVELLESLIDKFMENVRGTDKCRSSLISDKLFAEVVPKFILNYNKCLFEKVNKSRNNQISELVSKLENTENQIEMLKTKLEAEETYSSINQKLH